MLTYTSRNFHLAYQIAFFDGNEIIEKIIHDKKIFSEVIPSDICTIETLKYLAVLRKSDLISRQKSFPPFDFNSLPASAPTSTARDQSPDHFLLIFSEPSGLIISPVKSMVFLFLIAIFQ